MFRTRGTCFLHGKTRPLLAGCGPFTKRYKVHTVISKYLLQMTSCAVSDVSATVTDEVKDLRETVAKLQSKKQMATIL